MDEWQSISTAPEGAEIMTKIDDAAGTRNAQTLIRRGRLWFVPGEWMYVYYTPTHWKPAVEEDGRTIAAAERVEEEEVKG
ncbi:hypothetical protein [Paraburkholderia antibiotica]|uniref:DUF551 domain-containing protein n=1 Tax=Paraburkholderia antibiotica TaxID=2728839 RepID=A0A7Y0A1N9_9BURK|nr:hypothetical protein [Paraburkholderia antibiotica]NML34881.1 hypothetical protein [Paraburkholderia antibiotica]